MLRVVDAGALGWFGQRALATPGTCGQREIEMRNLKFSTKNSASTLRGVDGAPRSGANLHICVKYI